MSTEGGSGGARGEGENDRTAYVCVHGHFYQPPRENPWLEEIEVQDSAYPYHDWNERITNECYASNAAARILDEDGLISKITNNYARMSFDFGPTLLAWLERRRPEVLRAIVDADALSREAFSGHGSAMAQTYNHMIQPLATPRDRRTQVIWGLRDFEHRFGRFPQGMWLPETAVNLDSLEALAEFGVRFTVLAPHQAARTRRVGESSWRKLGGTSTLDIGIPYTVELPSGRSIAVFFYEGPISRAIAFEKLLDSGAELSHRLLSQPIGALDGPRLMHVATDGETYGHHHRFGDMALSFALEAVGANEAARLTNYAEFLDRNPPTHEADIIEDTSWSCVHGIDRWRADCGCRVGTEAGSSQAWRRPLREALDWLRDQLGPLFEHRARAYLTDPWAARDDYIDVVLDRSEPNVTDFLEKHAHHRLNAEDRVCVLELLEMQRHAMLMYTSCGWFFDDLAGIETLQILSYAGRAIQLAERRGAARIEADFLDRLHLAVSNRPEEGDGASIYERHVKPIRIDLRQVCAHYAISSLFDGYEDSPEVYCYAVDQADYRKLSMGRAKLALGRCRVTSDITEEAEDQAFAVVYLGDHNLVAGVREAPAEDHFSILAAELSEAFQSGNLPACLSLLEKHVGPVLYSLPSLFRDQRRAVLTAILDAAVADVETSARRLYDQHAPLRQFLVTADHPLSRGLRMASEITFNSELRRALEPHGPNLDLVQEILGKSARWNVDIDRKTISYLLEQAATVIAEELLDGAEGLQSMALLEQLVELARSREFDLNLWRAQNAFYFLMQRRYTGRSGAAAEGDADATAWIERARSLGHALRVRVG